jgi:hypothetical protein
MKISILTFTFCITFGYSLSYQNKWTVRSSCTGSQCCCPSQDSLVVMKDGGSDRLMFQVLKGNLENCNQYGWTTDDIIQFPFNDQTLIPSNGINTTYIDKNGNAEIWSFSPSIIPDGDSAQITLKTVQASTYCSFQLSSLNLVISSQILAIVIICLVFF